MLVATGPRTCLLMIGRTGSVKRGAEEAVGMKRREKEEMRDDEEMREARVGGKESDLNQSY